MSKKKNHNFCIGIWNCDTESSVEGYISAFMANRFECRLKTLYPVSGRLNPSKRYLNLKDKADALINSLPDKVRLTQQQEIRDFANRLQDTSERAADIYCQMDKELDRKKINVYWILNFANLAWDFDVLRGIIFNPDYGFDCVGSYSDLIQFSNGHIVLRDFLRLTGFTSVKMAGMVCMSAKKKEGGSVYRIRKKDIPKSYYDYTEEQIDYMENDVLVMDEALNIILNRRENLTIETMNDLPLTATGFGRWRYNHNPEIVIENGKELNVSAMLTLFRWKYARPFILYLMRAYKGGYCGPNPHIQYKIIENVICKDAVSMYPHKMLFFEMMQANKYTKMVECPYTIEECLSSPDPVAKSALYRVKCLYDYIKTFDDESLMTVKADDHTDGIVPYIATVELNIYGVREKNGIRMMPFLSKHKIENEPQDLVNCNGKVLSGSGIITIMSSLDLVLLILCYDCKIIRLRKWLTLSWRPMLPVQKRDLWYAYQRKMHISEILKKDRYGNDDYWKDECGFDPNIINGLPDEDYRTFTKAYKALTKADPNGKYGMTVEKPIHPKTTMNIIDGLPDFDTESTNKMNARVLSDVMKNTPNYVKASDYCAGSSITMWARWQLVTMMYCLFVHGIETYYCDTDSLFVSDCQETEKCFELYNKRLKEFYYETEFGCGRITIDDAEQLGQFETDKKCKLFRTLGAKNYAYYTGSEIKLTVAGLRSKDFEKHLKDKLRNEPPEKIMREYYRPNTFVLPEACHKLLKDCTNMGYDKDGLWRGPVLTECGFAMIDLNAKDHIRNAVQAALSQGMEPSDYLGEFFNPLYITDEGFSEKLKTKKSYPLESFDTLEDRQPIPKGVV